MSKQPLVSVIITTYNRAKLVQEAVQSVFNQTYKNYEIIIIDDGSVNGTKKVISQLSSKKIRYIYQDNHGYAHAENQGMQQARGKYIAFLDSDDLFMPDKLEKQVAIMEENPNVILSHHSYQRMNGNGEFVSDVYSGRLSGEIYLDIIIQCIIGSPTVMLRKSALLNTDRFVGDIGGDVVLWAGIAKRSDVLGIDEVLSKVRVQKSTTAFLPKKQMIALRNIIDSIVKKDNDMQSWQRNVVVSAIYFIMGYHFSRRVFGAIINTVIKYHILTRELLGKTFRLSAKYYKGFAIHLKRICKYVIGNTISIYKFARWLNGRLSFNVYKMIREHAIPLNLNDYKLARLKDKHKGQRCFIIGNAPSLAKTDLTFIKDEITFGVNKIYRTGFSPTYYLISDRLILEQNADDIKGIKKSVKLYPDDIREYVKKDNAIYFHTKTAPLHYPEFSSNAMAYVYHGETVTYLCLQLAYYMGIKEVYLIGTDWDWGKEYNKMPFGSIVEGGEHTHFSKDYHSAGEKWVTPNIEIGLKVFKKAKQFYEAHGGKIYNATKGGKLEVFPRVNYADVVKAYEYNTVYFQKKFWREKLLEYSKKNTEIYGYEWGNPDDAETKDSAGNVLGNYRKIKDKYLLPFIKNKTVLELGCGGGKWVQFMLLADEIICVDLNEIFFDYIKEKIHSDKLTFYMTAGYELLNIKDKSVDLIFSMDTLVRVSRDNIKSYFKEFARVLKPSGKICLHLPCSDIKSSFDWHFTDLSLDEIKQLCKDSGFMNYQIDKDTIKHGVILRVGYGKN